MLSRVDKDILIYLEQYKGITIRQCSRHFFRQSDRGEEYARKKLRHMETEGLLKSYINSITKQKVYYVTDKLSAHDLFIMDFYSKLVECECENIEFKKKPRYLKGLIEPDALFKFEFGEAMYLVLLEVELGHFTEMGKFQLYEKLYREEEIQKVYYGIFPQLVFMGWNTLRYLSKNFEVVPVDYDLYNFGNVLGLVD